MILAIIVIAPTVFNSKTVSAYDSSSYVDGGKFTNVGSSYEVDWGCIAWGSDKASDGSVNNLSSDYPPTSRGNIRYDHWCGTHPEGEHGWSVVSNNRWWANNVYNDPLIPSYGDYDGGYPLDVFLYGPMYYADYSWLSGGSPWWISGTGNDYRRWGIQQYKREKPTPVMTDMGVSNFSKYYATSDKSLWATPSDNGQFWCQAEDRYSEKYGNDAQKDGAIRRGLIWITGTNGLDYFGYTDMNKNTKDTTFCCDDTKDKEWINLKEKVAGKKDEEWIKLKEKIVGMSNEESVTQ